jgi:hypothetical protein
MIKSKFKSFQFFGQFVMTGLLLLLLFLFYVAFFSKYPTPIFSGLGMLCTLITVVFPIYIVGQMKLNYKTVVINTEAKAISFTFFLVRITKTYPMDYFDGYIETKVTDKYDTYKCFYLVKDGKLKYKISGRFYENIDELQHGLSSLRYMGFIKYSSALSLKIAFNKSIL